MKTKTRATSMKTATTTVDLTATKIIMGGGVRQFTWTEIEATAGSTSRTSLSQPRYTVIHGRVYDLSGDFLHWHPGGDVAFSQIGKDASGAFEVFHAEDAEAVLANFYVGDLAPTEVKKPTGFAEDVQKLRKMIDDNGWYKSSKTYYLGKVVFNVAIWASALAVLVNHGDTVSGLVGSAFLLALFGQQCGWLAHDFLHHQVFENRVWNKVVGYFLGNICQGLSIAWWKKKHCTHHSVPNVHLEDPDIDTLPFLAWSEDALELFSDYSEAAAAKFMVSYQPILFFPLLAFARMAWGLDSIRFNLPNSPRALFGRVNRSVEIITLAIHWGWFFGMAYLCGSVWRGVAFVLMAECMTGILLAIVFSLNHNGMPILVPSEAKEVNFYELQVITGRDVLPSFFTTWLMGGLNYQIEHHMFPSLPRHNFHLVSPYVKTLCEKHGVRYHTTSFRVGLGEVMGRLDRVSKVARGLGSAPSVPSSPPPSVKKMKDEK